MKNILLVVTGSVAVIKIKRLKKLLSNSFNIKTIVSDYVLQNYNNVEELKPIFENKNLDSFPDHIKLAKWADLILVAPASANTISKFNAGIADSQVNTTLIAHRKPIIFVPAMNTYMYDNLKARGILDKISGYGHMFIGPDYGLLREGEIGIGRMTEPEEIANKIRNYFTPKKERVLISFGASKTWIDDVRYITNEASGKMGKLLANEMKLNGFDVSVVNISNLSNKEVLNNILQKEIDIYISTAALSDIYLEKFNGKLKKGNIHTLNLKPNIDVITKVKLEKPNLKIIGFKNENNENNAIAKMKKLNLDFMIWNKLGSAGSDYIEGAIISKENKEYFKTTKRELVKLIVRRLT